MQRGHRSPDNYSHGEDWVLGAEGPNFDHSGLITKLRTKYQTDFINQWRAYLKAASFVSYKDPKDAAQKLDVLSSNASALLALLELASKNTDVDDPSGDQCTGARAFRSPPGSDRVIGPQNQSYINALSALQASDGGVRQVGGHEPRRAHRQGSRGCRRRGPQAVKQLSSMNFNADPEAISTASSSACSRLLSPMRKGDKGKVLPS